MTHADIAEDLYIWKAWRLAPEREMNADMTGECPAHSVELYTLAAEIFEVQMQRRWQKVHQVDAIVLSTAGPPPPHLSR